MVKQIPELGRFAEPALLILVSLSDGPKHGYAIMADVEAGTGRPLGPGTLYRVLRELRQEGMIVRSAERADETDERRHYHELTPLGRAVLQAEGARLKRTLGMAGMLRPAEGR